MRSWHHALKARRTGEGGFTLVEMVVVVGIITVLLAIGSLAFHSMNDKYRIESQVKQMQADFDNLRLVAMTSKQNCSITLNPKGYSFLSYSSAGDPGHTPNGVPAGTVTLQYPIQQFAAGAYAAFSNTLLSIDARGCLTSPAAPFYIAVAPGVDGPAVNAVALQAAKSNIGQIQGGSCVLQ